MKKFIASLLLCALFVVTLVAPPEAEARDRHARVGDRSHKVSRGNHNRVKVNNNRRDVRTKDVRKRSINNVHINNNRNVNVNVNRRGGCCGGGWDDDDDWNPVATAAAVTAAAVVTSAVVGSIVHSVPPSCVPVNYGGVVYQQCGNTWYQPQYVGSQIQYSVINPPY
jgi:hypothetical protein